MYFDTAVLNPTTFNTWMFRNSLSIALTYQIQSIGLVIQQHQIVGGLGKITVISEVKVHWDSWGSS